MTPYTGDWHVWNVGLLIEQLRVVEYSARVAIGILQQKGSSVDFANIREGDWVPEDTATSYDQLDAVLRRFNELAPAQYQVDVRRVVDLRHQLAHGRLVSLAAARRTRDHFPLITVKFGKPKSGRVQVTARIEMTEEWFREQRLFLDRAVHAVMFAQGPALLANFWEEMRQRQASDDKEAG